MFQKRKRVENGYLMDLIIKAPCCICGRGNCDPSHVKTRASGGPDVEWNIFPMCRFHHTEWGQIGWKKFLMRYPIFKFKLRLKGWDTEGDRLTHPSLGASSCGS